MIVSTSDRKTINFKDDGICPKCSDQLWDNRTNKRNPKAPDFKCKNKACELALWIKTSGGNPTPPTPPKTTHLKQTGIADEILAELKNIHSVLREINNTKSMNTFFEEGTTNA